VRLSLKLLPGFPLAYIGVDLTYASCLFAVPNMNFNLLQQSLTGPCGSRFLRKAKRHARAVFVWTVNEESWMEWSIRKELDGVITDDPKLFLEVCDRWKEDNCVNKSPGRTAVKRRSTRWTAKQMMQVLIFYMLLAIYLPIVTLRYGLPKHRVSRALGS
jgi:phosphatidylglycerol phospholipase C